MGATLFVRPKAFDFIAPQIDCQISEKEEQFVLRFTASCFVKSVCLSLRDHDAVFSDNWFDIHGTQPVQVTLPRQGALSQMSVEELRSQLVIAHY
jgi:beta-mannosidase